MTVDEEGGESQDGGGAGGALGRALGDLVFPPVCMGCGQLCEGSALQHVCRRCDALMMRVGPPHCTTCGHPFFGVVEGERLCPHCEGLHPAFNEGRVLTLYRGAGLALVQELKYHRGQHVLADVTTVAAGHRYFRDFLRDAVLVPVPLHPRKKRERGYNQAELLAASFAAVAGPTTRVEVLLGRVEDTDSQTMLYRKTRREQIKNAFALAPGAALTPGQRYLLVDDVFTTGSTLNACARVLRRGGAMRIDVVTFGHG